MLSLTIPLDQILIDPDKEVDLLALAPDEVEHTVRDAYAFLPPPVEISITDGVAHIQSLKKPSKNAGESPELLRRATKFAGQGNYSRAMELYGRVLERDPGNIEARRNLGMALLEMGRVEEARARLVETARLAPNDVWTYLLLANSYAKSGAAPKQEGLEKSLRFYHIAYTNDPNDLYVITSFAGVLAQTGRSAKAKELMQKARDIDPAYPNTAFGLALMALNEGQADEADEILVNLFRQPLHTDPRSEAVYAACRELALEANVKLAQQALGEMQAAVEARRQTLEEVGGIPIEVTPDDSIVTLAVTKMAWNYSESRHRILHKNADKIIVLHLIAHELEHIELEAESRAQDRHRALIGTTESIERAFRSLDRELNRLRQQGQSDILLTQTVTGLIHGMNSQLFNQPFDMLIEWRVARHLPQLRPAQVLSLVSTVKDNMKVFTNPTIRKVTPPTIYEGSTALNYAYALYADWLLERRTALAAEIRQTGGLSSSGQKNGEKIFAL